MLPILKFLGIAFAAVAGVYALLHDFKKDGRITKEGRTGIGLIVGAGLLGIVTYSVELIEQRNQAVRESERQEELIDEILVSQNIIDELSIWTLSVDVPDSLLTRVWPSQGDSAVVQVMGRFVSASAPIDSIDAFDWLLTVLGIAQARRFTADANVNASNVELTHWLPSTKVRPPTYAELSEGRLYLTLDVWVGDPTKVHPGVTGTLVALPPPSSFFLDYGRGRRSVYPAWTATTSSDSLGGTWYYWSVDQNALLRSDLQTDGILPDKR